MNRKHLVLITSIAAVLLVGVVVVGMINGMWPWSANHDSTDSYTDTRESQSTGGDTSTPEQTAGQQDTTTTPSGNDQPDTQPSGEEETTEPSDTEGPTTQPETVPATQPTEAPTTGPVQGSQQQVPVEPTYGIIFGDEDETTGSTEFSAEDPTESTTGPGNSSSSSNTVNFDDLKDAATNGQG